jgi:hypothetical protein
MNHLNVFNNPYFSWKYPDCWIKNARMFFRSFKYAYQRVTRGWANCDTFDLDDYLEHVLYESLNYLADNHMGWPCNDKFPTDEDWTKYLKDMAQKFYTCNEVNDTYPHPEEDKWWKWIQEHPKEEHIIPNNKNPYAETMIAEANENDKKRAADLAEGLKMLAHVWRSLWD